MLFSIGPPFFNITIRENTFPESVCFDGKLGGPHSAIQFMPLESNFFEPPKCQSYLFSFNNKTRSKKSALIGRSRCVYVNTVEKRLTRRARQVSMDRNESQKVFALEIRRVIAKYFALFFAVGRKNSRLSVFGRPNPGDKSPALKLALLPSSYRTVNRFRVSISGRRN